MNQVRVLVAACTAALSIAAQAHVRLDHADPRVGSTVQAAPAEVRLWFTEKLEPAFSTVRIVDANGKRVDAGRAKVDPRNRLLLSVPVANIGPGVYMAVWRAVSIDTHVTEGRFTFRVAN